MKLLRAELIQFGKFAGQVFEFAPGLNVIFGPNESGKTTLHRFLAGMFFGFKKPGRNRRIWQEEREAYRPWAGGRYAGVLIYEAGGRRYRLERSFDPDRVRILDADTGKDLGSEFNQDARREYDFAWRHLGFQAQAFDRTISWPQLAAEIQGDDLAEEVRARLVNVASGGDDEVSVQRALDELKKASEAIGTVQAKTKPLGRLRARLDELERERQQARQLLQEVWIWQKERKELSSAIRQAQEECRRAEDAWRGLQSRLLRQRWQKAEHLTQKKAELNLLLGQLRQEASVLPDFRRLEEQWGVLQSHLDKIQWHERLLGEIEMRRSRFDQEEKEIEARRQQLGAIGHMPETQYSEMQAAMFRMQGLPVKEMRQRLTRTREKRETADRQNRLLRPLRLLSAVVLLVSAAMTYVSWTSSTAWFFLFISAAAAGAILLGQFRGYPRQQDFLRLKREEESLQLQLATLEREAAEWQAFVDRLLFSAGVADLQSWEAGWKLRRELDMRQNWLHEQQREIGEDWVRRQQQLERDKARFCSLLTAAGCLPEGQLDYSEDHLRHYEHEKQRWEDLQRQIDLISKEAEQAESLLNETLAGWTLESLRETVDASGTSLASTADGGVQDDSRTEADLPRLQEAWRTAERNLHELIRRDGELGALIEARLLDGRPLAEIEEEYQSKTQEYEEMLLRLEALCMAHDEIAAISEELRRSFAPELNRKVTGYVQKLSLGRYQQIHLDEHLQVRLRPPDQHTLVDLHQLSHGTVDLVYFAIRLAAAEWIGGTPDFPLFLDDPFIQADERRLQAALQMVQQISEEHQVFLFTCHRHVLQQLQDMEAPFHRIRLA